MEKEIKELLKAQLPEIEEEFNQILIRRGLGTFRVRNFRLKPAESRECKKWKWICDPNTGRCYLRCVEKVVV